MRKYSIKKQFYVNQKEDDLLKVKVYLSEQNYKLLKGE